MYLTKHSRHLSTVYNNYDYLFCTSYCLQLYIYRRQLVGVAQSIIILRVAYHKLIWSRSRSDGEDTLFVFLAESRHTLMSLISIGSAGESMTTPPMVTMLWGRNPWGQNKFKFIACGSEHAHNVKRANARIILGYTLVDNADCSICLCCL